MIIHTLGTSHGDSTLTRFNSSTAYETADGALYLVDCGAPCEALLRRKGLCIRNVRAVLITHMHDDHAGGLTGFIKQTIKYPQGRTTPLSIFLPEENAVIALKNWFAALHEPPDHPLLRWYTTPDGLVYEDDLLRVTSIRTQHLRTRGRTEGDPCSFAYMLHFKQENLTVLHTGDLRSDFADFPSAAQDEHFDVCLCEATHYPPEDALPLLMTAKLSRLIFIHIADRWHLPGGEEALLESFSQLPYPVQIAHDGDTFPAAHPEL